YYKEFSIPRSTIDEHGIEKKERSSSYQNSEYFDVAGAFVKHRKSHLLNHCFVGDEIELIPEPKNPHDPDAIKVRCNGKLIGYVPRTDTDWVHKAIKGDYYAELIYKDTDGYSVDAEIEINF